MLLSPSLSASGEAANLGKILQLPVHLCGNPTCAVVAHQDNHPFVELPNQPLKGSICDIRGGTRPPYNQSPLIQHETQFPADNPPVIREAFAADLLRAAAFAHGMDQLDAVGVNDAEHRWSSQESLRPVLMGREEAKEPRPLGELGKQRAIVSGQPAIERPVAHAFEGMEQP